MQTHYLIGVTSRTWSVTTTKALLTNEVYLGVQVFGDWRNEAAHPAIIDRETWDAVQARLGTQPKRSGDRHEDEYTYYLRGRVVCPHCGCAATQASSTGRMGRVHYYVCQKANRHFPCPDSLANRSRPWKCGSQTM